jgi:hypothetical protein
LEHPDVEALSLACPDPALHTTQPIRQIPMLERSWRLLVKASQAAPHLIPLHLWQDVFALMSAPPFLVWSPEPDVRREVGRQLASAAFGRALLRQSVDGAPRELAVATRDVPSESAIPLPSPARTPRRTPQPFSRGWRAFRWLRPDVVADPETPAVQAQTHSESPEIQLASVAEEATPLSSGAAEALGLPPAAVSQLWRDYGGKL